MFFFPLKETKELESYRIAAIKAEICSLPCRLCEVGLAENRKIVLVWQCFRNHCTANMLDVQCGLPLSINCTYCIFLYY